MEELTVEHNCNYLPTITLTVVRLHNAYVAGMEKYFKANNLTSGYYCSKNLIKVYSSNNDKIPEGFCQLTIINSGTSTSFTNYDISIALHIARLSNNWLHLYSNWSPKFYSYQDNCSKKREDSSSVLRQHSVLNSAEIDHWIRISDYTFPNFTLSFPSEFPPSYSNTSVSLEGLLQLLNQHLRTKTFIVGRTISIADIVVYSRIKMSLLQTQLKISIPLTKQCIRGNQQLTSIKSSFLFPGKYITSWPHACRWYDFIDYSLFQTLEKPSEVFDHGISATTKSSGHTFENALVGAIKGQVVLRFPPEPSGYLHIGHAKAALLNSYFAKIYEGKLILRFDDTNPVKEKLEFEDAIKMDLGLLGITPDNTSYTSQYFDKLQEIALKLINDQKAYVDDTPLTQLRHERTNGIESKCRNKTIDENIEIWQEMINGTDKGIKHCLRGKIDMANTNMCLRDPVLYRCIVSTPHHKHGYRYKVYPTYDFACPIVDSLEGVTHAMRTNEYSDRIPLYNWVLEAADLPKVHIYEFSRLNFVKTVLSKRQLNWFVENKYVDGWDDPRFPTVRGIIRRGLLVEALMKFIINEGPSKSGRLKEWDKLWSINKQIIDPIAKRYTAVDSESVVLHIMDGPTEPIKEERYYHSKNEKLGKTFFFKYKDILIEKDDAKLCSEGEEITLMRWGNIIVDKIEQDSMKKIVMYGHLNLCGDFKKTSKKLHWLPKINEILTPIVLREYDHLINTDKIESTDEINFTDFVNKESIFDSHALADQNVSELFVGEIIQFERRGFFRLDNKDDQQACNMIFIKIPDGRCRSMSTITTKVDAAKFSRSKFK